MVTQLKRGIRDPSRVTVKVGRRVLVTMDELTVHRMRLKVGVEITDAMVGPLREAAEEDRVKRLALRRLERSMCSEGGLLDSLKRRGASPEAAAKVAGSLKALGLLDDDEFARVKARAILTRRPAGRRLIESKLIAAKVKPERARLAAAEAMKGRDALEDALGVARRAARSLPSRLDADAKRRRLFGTLARRGFEADVVRRVVEKVLGRGGETNGEECE